MEWLWVDKYRPQTLDELELHPHISVLLKNLCQSDNFTHILMYGPPGSGKRTRVSALLEEIYGPEVKKSRKEVKAIAEGKKKTIDIVASNLHIEMNPSDVGSDDIVVVQQVIKEITLSMSTDPLKTFKVLVIKEADRLSHQAQHALRRTMEKHTLNCRLILLCNSTSKIIEPIKSRTMMIRIPAPVAEDVDAILQKIAFYEGITLDKETSRKIAEGCGGNLRRAISNLETCKVKGETITVIPLVLIPDWETIVSNIVSIAKKEPTLATVQKIRPKLVQLLGHCIPPENIMRKLLSEMLKGETASLAITTGDNVVVSKMQDMKMQDVRAVKADLNKMNYMHEVTKFAAEYEHSLQKGYAPLYHIEAFVVRFITLYKK